MIEQVLAVTFDKKAMGFEDGHFSIPVDVCNLLDLESGGLVHLIISSPKGGLLWAGTRRMRSGLEIYGPDMAERIKAGDLIRVTVSVP